MNLTLRVGRFTITLLDVEIDEDEGPAPSLSAVSDNERDPIGFTPGDDYWEDDRAHR